MIFNAVRIHCDSHSRTRLIQIYHAHAVVTMSKVDGLSPWVYLSFLQCRLLSRSIKTKGDTNDFIFRLHQVQSQFHGSNTTNRQSTGDGRWLGEISWAVYTMFDRFTFGELMYYCFFACHQFFTDTLCIINDDITKWIHCPLTS